MKLSINWLKDYVDPKVSTDELVHRLTMAGLEVEEVHSVGKDTVLDLEITPNRPDCLNTLGLAREISAICAKDLAMPNIKRFKALKPAGLSIVIENKKDCPRYIGTVIENVVIKDAPARMTERLQSLGLRPIVNAVDITNFVLMEMGQPLHVFDRDKIEGGKIIVRRAHSGEKIVTLDGIERKLDPSILVIADAKKPIAIAGIMGGQESQVTQQTKHIVLESAQFDMGLIRRASRTLGLKSDSSYRFERGVDIACVLDGADRAAGLLIEMTQGRFAGRMDVGVKTSGKARVIRISIDEIEGLLGSTVKASAVKSALVRLGLKVTAGKKDEFKVIIPSFRGDLKASVDIIEEVARIIGYDRLEVSFPHIQVLNIAPDVRPRNVRRTVSAALIAQGYNETITFSLISQKDLDRCQIKSQGIGVDNALSSEHNLMRPSMLPSMLAVAAINFNRGQKELRIFEIGKCYFKEGERWTLSMLCTGRKSHDWRQNSKEAMDMYDIKGALEQALVKLGASGSWTSGAYPGLEDGAALFAMDQHVLGAVGRVPKNVLQQWGIKSGDVYFAQMDLQPIFQLPRTIVKYEPIAEFPSIVRDISIAVDKTASFGAIKGLCQRLGKDILQQVHLVEEYTGDKIQEGKRGLVLSLLYQSKERTLREDEVNIVHQHIVEALAREFAAVLR